MQIPSKNDFQQRGKKCFFRRKVSVFCGLKARRKGGLLIVIITNNKSLVKHFEGPDAGFPQKIRNKYKKDLDAPNRPRAGALFKKPLIQFGA